MATTSKVSLKLLIDSKGHRVLFAEASKDFVDFLFTLLSLPLGAVVGLLENDNMVGCLGNLYKSIQDLNDTYIQPKQSKDSILRPTVHVSASESPLLLPNVETEASRKPYLCQYYSGNHPYVAERQGMKCPSCNGDMCNPASYVDGVVAKEADNAGGSEGGFVKGVVTYMVMDDLEVTPMSTISSFSVLKKFNIPELGVIEEKVVELGLTEALKILKASLQSKNVLTSVFIGKKVV